MKLQPAGGATRSFPDEGERGPGELAEIALVTAAIVQGLVLGAWLGIFPAAALRAGGLPAAPLFFVRWAGVLHVALALGFGLEWTRFRRVTLLVAAKGIIASFIAITWMGEGVPALMAVALPVEAGMALVGALLHGPADRSRRARARLRLVAAAPTEIRPAGRR
jgi:hypothetical protein